MSTAATPTNSYSFRNVKRLTEANKRKGTILSFLLIPLSGLITDIYIPSMPQMAQSLGQTEPAIQLTLTLFLVSYGLTQFITGSLLDSIGRYRVTLWSLAVFTLSCLITAWTSDILWIYSMRVVQGVATGFIVVGKRAFFVDVYDGEKRKHYLSIMSIVWSSAPVLAPFVGGYLEHYFNWQANFYLLAVYGMLMLILEWIFSGETVRQFRKFSWTQISHDYSTMLKTRIFTLGLLTVGLCYGSTMLFNLSGAFIIEHRMNYSPVVTGYAALSMGLAWMCGGFLGKATLKRAFLPKLRLANILQLLIVVLMIISAAWLSTLFSLLGFAFLIHMAVGFIFNIYFAYCLGRFPEMAGVASGLAGGANFIITSIISYSIVGILHPVSQQTLGYAYLVTTLMAAVILQFLVRVEKDIK